MPNARFIVALRPTFSLSYFSPLSLACLSAALAGSAGCSSNGASPPAPLDASASDGGGLPVEASIDAPAPGIDATPGDAAPNDASDGAISESTDPFTIATAAPTSMVGAASSDGSAILLLTGEGAPLSYTHYEPTSGWSALAALPGGTAPSDAPRAGIDATGNVFVAWTSAGTIPVEGGVDAGILDAGILDAGILDGGILDGGTLDGGTLDGGDGGGFEAGSPGAGSAIILNVVRYDHASRTWAAVEHPDPYDQTLGTTIAMAVNGPGDALVFDLHMGATGTHDASIQHYSKGTWTQELAGTQDNTVSLGAPLVRFSDSGNAVSTWSAGGSGTFMASTRSGLYWTPTPKAGFSGGAIDLTVDEFGDVLIGWEDSSTVPNVYQFDATSASWSAPHTLTAETESQRFADCPLTVSLTTGGDGTLVRCFTGAGVARTIESYSFTNGTKTWGSAKPLATSGWPFAVALAMNEAGNGLAVWTNSSSATPEASPAVLSTHETATGWSAPSAPISGTGAGQTTTFLSSNGRGWAAWVENGAVTKVKKVR
jgi:hypothetical protein